MISPFAPLYPWLIAACNGYAWTSDATYPDATEPTPETLIDLRHGPTRYAVIRALHNAGHSRPWALGQPWSNLTDEQAGRVTAEIVRAVGEDPSKPAGMVPVCVLGAWKPCCGRVFSQPTGNMEDERPHLVGARISHGIGERGWLAGAQSGPETGEPGRLDGDAAARALGCIMIEDITP